MHLSLHKDTPDPTWRPDYRSHAGGPSSGRAASPIFQSISFRQGQELILLF